VSEAPPEWSDRLRQVFRDPPAVAPPSAPDHHPGLALELAEERAAIMEHDGGLTRRRAEALAYQAHGLKPPRSE